MTGRLKAGFPRPFRLLIWMVFFSLPAYFLPAQEADDGSQPQRSRLRIGSGLQGGDLVALSLIQPDENKVELTVAPGESVDALRNRLVAAINATAQTSALVSAVNGGSGEILLTGKTAGQTIAVYFDTGGADVLTQELIHRAVPANENMIPGYVPEGGYSNANFAVNVVHQAEWFRNTDPGTGAGTSLSAADGNYSSEIEDSLPLSLDASGWPAGTHRVGIRFSDEFGDWSPVRWFTVLVVDPSTVQEDPATRPEVTDIKFNPGYSPGSAYLVEVNGTEYRYVIQTGDSVSMVRDAIHQLILADSLLTSEKIGTDTLRLTGKTSREIGPKLKLEGDAVGTLTEGQSSRESFPRGKVPPVIRKMGGAEYFIGTDPGEGSATSINPEDLVWDEESEGFNLPGLDPSSWTGDRRIGVRFKDDLGRWGPVLWQEITVFNPNSVQPDDASTAQVDQITIPPGFQPGDWFRVTLDGTPYEFNATTTDLNTTRDGLIASLSGNPKVDVSTLPGGTIVLTGKTPGDSYTVGVDSNASVNPTKNTQPGRPAFPTSTVPPVTRSIGGAEYYVNDPNGTILISPEDLAYDGEHEGITPLEINASGLTGGEHRIGLRFKDDLDRWSPYQFIDLTVFDPGTVDAEEENRDQVTELTVGHDFIEGDDLNCTLNGIAVNCKFQPGETIDTFCQRVCNEINAACSSFCTATYLGNGKCQFVCTSGPCEITCDGTGTTTLNQLSTYRPSFPIAVTPPETRKIVGAEYYLNDNNATQSLSPEDLSFDSEHEGILPLEINASALPGGEHRIGLRFKDDQDRWSPHSFIDLTVFNPDDVVAQEPALPQVDTLTLQPGFQPGDHFTVTVDGTPYEYNATSPDLNGTRDGLIALLASDPTVSASPHSGTDGGIVLTGKTPGQSYLVNIEGNSTASPLYSTQPGQGIFPQGVQPPAVREIRGAEYFVGPDPGPGNGIPVSAEDLAYDGETEGIQSITLPPAAWSAGNTRVGTRVRDDQGRWSPVVYREITVFDPTTVNPEEESLPQKDILTWGVIPNAGDSHALQLGNSTITYVANGDENASSLREWFFQTLEGNSTLTQNYRFLREGNQSIVIEGKTDGYSYWVYLDGNGTEKGTVSRQQDPRYAMVNGTGSPSPIRLTEAEYFIDTDPGVGNGIPMSAENLPWDETTLALANVSTLGLPYGEHTLGVRFKNSLGNWSPTRLLHFGLDSLEEGLTGHWMLDDNSTTASDSSGLDRHGTLTAMESTPWEMGKMGLALRMENSTGRIDLTAHLNEFKNLNEGTVSLWFRTPLPAQTGTLWSASGNSGASSFRVSTGNGKLGVYDVNGTALVEHSVSYGDNTWHLLTYTSSASGSTLYLNDQKVSSGNSFFLAAVAGMEGISIGANPDGSLPFTGLLDDVRLYSRKLNDSEAGLLYSQANLDTDGDGLPDGMEALLGGDPALADTDGDGLLDGAEYYTHNTRVDRSDSDGDGLSDRNETIGYTHPGSGKTFTSNPLVKDTDGDTFSDYIEVLAGKDPNNPNEFPNLAPTVISLSPHSVYENREANTTVGFLQVTDPNPGDTHTLELISGALDSFLLSGKELKTSKPLDHETTPQLTLLVRATDQDGDSVEKSVLVEVMDYINDRDEDGLTNAEETELGTDPDLEDTDGDNYNDQNETLSGTDPLDPNDWPGKPNTPPHGLTFTPLYPVENISTPVPAGSLTAEDIDKRDTHTYQLISGPGDDHNSFFTLSGTGTLLTAGPLDYELTPDHNYSIRVEVTDNRGGTFSKTIKVPVADDLQDRDEDGLDNGQEASLGTNPDNADTDGDGYQDKVETDAGTDPLDPNEWPNKPNSLPTDILLTALYPRENLPAGQLAAELQAVDPDKNDFHSFRLVEGTGDEHNSFFTMQTQNGNLLSASPLDYELTPDHNYSIRVEVTDNRGGKFVKALKIPVMDDDSEDTDQDGLTQKEESELGLNDNDPDFDKDGHSDGSEISNGTDPKDPFDPRPPNNNPNDLNLAPTSIMENRPAGTVVGKFNTYDPDPWETVFSYSLVDGNGSTDNGLFQIDANGSLQTAQVLDFEAGQTRSIRARTTDEAGGYFDKIFSIQVLDDSNEDTDQDGLSELEEDLLGTSDQKSDTDGDGHDDRKEVDRGTDPLDPNEYPIDNHAPTDISLSPNSVLESAAFGSLVGTLSAQDQDTGDTHQFSLVNGNGSQDNLSFSITGNQLKSRDNFDFEKKSLYKIRVMSKDAGGLSVEKELEVTILDNTKEDGDGDGLDQETENNLGTNDLDPDSDDDGSSDGYEVSQGTDPLDPLDSPSSQMGFAWARKGGMEAFDSASSIVADDAGNSYVTGAFTGNVEFEGGANLKSHGGSDVFVAKFDKNGIIKWALAFRGQQNDRGLAIALDEEKNILVSGTYGGAGKKSPYTHNLAVGGIKLPEGTYHGNAFLAKLDQTGKPLWAKGFPSMEGGSTIASALSTGPNNEIFVGGYYNIIMQDSNGVFLPFGRKRDGFLAKLLPNGTQSWIKTFQGAGNDNVGALESSSEGSVWAAVELEKENKETRNIQIAGQTIEENGQSLQLLVEIDGQGNVLNHSVVSRGGDMSLSSLVKVPGGLVGVGKTGAVENMGGNSLKSGEFISKFNDSGNVVYAKNSSAGSSIAPLPGGELVAIGSMVEKFSADGSSLWRYPRDGFGISTDLEGSIYVCGEFSDTSVFLPHNKKSRGNMDAYVAKFGSFVPNAPPSAIKLSTTGLGEELLPSAVSITLSAADNDFGDVHSFALIDEEGNPDNSMFQIVERNKLLPTGPLDFETREKYSIRIQVHDGKGGLLAETFVLTVRDDDLEDKDGDGLNEKMEDEYGLSDLLADFDGDGFSDLEEIQSGSDPLLSTSVPAPPNESPTGIRLESSDIPENLPPGSLISLLEAIDSNQGDSHTFTLKENTNEFFEIKGNTLVTRKVLDFENKNTHLIEIIVEDSSGATKTVPIQISVTDVMEKAAPTDLLLTPARIDENKPARTVMGQVQVIDPNSGDSHELILVSGNEFFELLKDGRLTTRASFDHEFTKQIAIEIMATDQGGLSIKKSFTILIDDVFENLPVEDLLLSSNRILENKPSGTVVGYLSAVDQNAQDGHLFLLEKGGNKFSLTEDGNLTTTTSFDYESNPYHQIIARVSDATGSVFRKEFRVDVVDVFENTKPSPPHLSPSIIAHSSPIGKKVGVLSATDVDLGQTLSYELIQGVGSSDNEKFRIEGQSVITNEISNFFSQSRYSIRVRVIDSMDAHNEASLVVSVTRPAEADLFGSLIGTPSPWPSDFVDSDGDRIDDRWQAAPFKPSQQPPDFYAFLTIIYGGKETYETTRRVVRGNTYPLRTPVFERGWKFRRWEGMGVKKPKSKFTSIRVSSNQTVSAIYARSLRGKYVNGYVVGAKVFFDSVINGGMNGVHDSNEPFAITGDSGDFDLDITDDQFFYLDVDGSGELDDDEGQIVCIGGTDVSSGLPVTTSYKAPATSTVVTPLTTIVSELIENGASKTNAENLVKSSLSVDQSVDLLHFDSVTEAANGNNLAQSALAASTQVANTISLASSFLDASAGQALDRKSSANIVSASLSKLIQDNENPLVNLGDANTMERVLTDAVNQSGQTLSVDESKVASSLIISVNQIVQDRESTSTDSATFKKRAAETQIGSAGIVEPTLRKLAGKIISPSEALSQANPEAVQKNIAQALANNSFAPQITQNFIPYKLSDSNSLLVGRLSPTDADGDTSFSYQVMEGNLDPDGDGNDMFNLNSETGELQIADLEDVEMMKKEIATLSVVITDLGGLSSETTLYVNFSGQSILHTISENVGNGWFQSSWLGSFYGTTSSNWIFHRQLGWVYATYAQSESAWLFSEHLGWLWTSRVFQASQWGHFIYSQEKNSWLLVKDWQNHTFLYDYHIGKWIMPNGMILGNWYEHPNFGLLFANSYAEDNGISGQTWNHPKLGLILSRTPLEAGNDLHPFKLIETKKWIVLGSNQKGETTIFDHLNQVNSSSAQVWDILQKAMEVNLTNDQKIKSISSHDWIPEKTKKYLIARLVFNLPI